MKILLIIPPRSCDPHLNFTKFPDELFTIASVLEKSGNEVQIYVHRTCCCTSPTRDTPAYHVQRPYQVVREDVGHVVGLVEPHWLVLVDEAQVAVTHRASLPARVTTNAVMKRIRCFNPFIVRGFFIVFCNVREFIVQG